MARRGGGGSSFDRRTIRERPQPLCTNLNPFAGGVIGDVFTDIRDVGMRVFLIAVIPAALSLVFRFRRAGGTERQQIKWLAYAAVLFGSIISIGVLGYEDLLSRTLSTLQVAVGFSRTLSTLLVALGFAGLYIAVGLAILRHHLYAIDVVINRTLVYGSLTAVLAAVSRWSPGPAVRLPGANWGRVTVCGSGIHADHRGPFHPAKKAHTELHRQALLSQEVRCRKDPRSLLN